jgi:hypothetical protein
MFGTFNINHLFNFVALNKDGKRRGNFKSNVMKTGM